MWIITTVSTLQEIIWYCFAILCSLCQRKQGTKLYKLNIEDVTFWISSLGICCFWHKAIWLSIELDKQTNKQKPVMTIALYLAEMWAADEKCLQLMKKCDWFWDFPFLAVYLHVCEHKRGILNVGVIMFINKRVFCFCFWRIAFSGFLKQKLKNMTYAHTYNGRNNNKV